MSIPPDSNSNFFSSTQSNSAMDWSSSTQTCEDLHQTTNPLENTISLAQMVANNEVSKIQKYIQDRKREEGEGWCKSNYIINDACRDAILQDKKEIVQLFLDEKLSPDADAHTNDPRRSLAPLKYIAAKVGNLAMVKLLVARGAKIKIEDSIHDNQDAMRGAIEGGHANVVQYLLNNGGSSDCGFEGIRLQTFLGRAAFNGQKDIVDLLAEHGARIKVTLSFNYQIFENRLDLCDSPISNWYDEQSRPDYLSEDKLKTWDQKKKDLIEKREVLLEQYSKSVQMILDHAMGTNFYKDEADADKFGPLIFLSDLDITGFNFVGVSYESEPITRELLLELGCKGVDEAIVTYEDIAKIKDSERQKALASRLEAKLQSEGKMISSDGLVNLVPLADAAKKGLFDVVQSRLSADIDPNQVTTNDVHSSFAIVAAAQKGFFEVVKLLAIHPKINPATRIKAFQEAKKEGHVQIVEYLSSLIDVNEKDDNGDTFIHKAVEAQDLKEIERLLSRGAKINLENGEDLTVLSIAANNACRSRPYTQLSEKDIAILEFLLKKGADPNKYNYYSPLYHAAQAGSFKAVQLLLPVTEKRDLKYKPLFQKEIITMPWYVPLMFDSYGSEEWLQILSLLKEHGADFNAVRPDSETLLDFCIRRFSCSFTLTRLSIRSLMDATDDLNNPILINKVRERFPKMLERLGW